jgi:hypothetical protein
MLNLDKLNSLKIPPYEKASEKAKKAMWPHAFDKVAELLSKCNLECHSVEVNDYLDELYAILSDTISTIHRLWTS